MKKLKYIISACISCLLVSKALVAEPPETPPSPKEVPEVLFNGTDRAFVVEGEFLYWTVQEGALDYALKMSNPAPDVTNTYAHGRMKRAEFECAHYS